MPAQALCAAAAPADTMPFIDGTLVPEKMRAAFAAGRVPHVPLMIGSNDAEAGFFGPPYWQGLQGEAGPDKWVRLQQTCCGYSRAMARGASAHAPVFAYHFAWVPPTDRPTARGAIHTAEIASVLGHVAADTMADSQSRALSRQLADRWVAFARTGDPALRPSDWPRFRACSDERVLLVGPGGVTVGPNPAEKLLDTIETAALPPRP